MSNIQVVKVGAQPKAVVLLFGWLGAQLRHVNKYAQLYNDRGCSTVTGVADSVSIMTFHKSALDEFASAAASQAAILMRASGNKDIPVIVHVFSNGGAFVLERLECLIASAEVGSDVALVGRNMKRGGQVFDSAPCYLHLSTGLKAITTAAPNVLVQWTIQFLFLVYGACSTASSLLLRRPLRPIQFWNHWETSSLATRQVYIYSTFDELADPIKLDELIESREMKGVDVTALKFTDSHHVQHYRAHPQKYTAVIDDLLDSIDINSK